MLNGAAQQRNTTLQPLWVDDRARAVSTNDCILTQPHRPKSPNDFNSAFTDFRQGFLIQPVAERLATVIYSASATTIS
jgi:hypothetical protein